MSDEDQVLSFGIEAKTGRPLKPLTDEAMRALLKGQKADGAEPARKRRASLQKEATVSSETNSDPNDLTWVGWGVLYGAGVSAKIKDALKPLLELRRREIEPLTLFEDTVKPGEDVHAWLKRHNVSLNLVDPAQGVPYYLLIVASPEDVPFEFQYTLDLYWACGRLWLETPAQFARYAESVVAHDGATPSPTKRQLALFAPTHDFDKATQLFTRQVAEPFAGTSGKQAALGAAAKYKLRDFIGAKATKENLLKIFRGKIDGGPPALLFSGSHGMQFADGEPRQLATQGALVCQDWGGYGAIDADDWFAASDLPADAHVHGLIHFMFACHGGGVPQFDNFDRLNDTPRQIAPHAFFSKLPQALLSHANGGALAVLAHMERAWAYSFQGDGGIPQNQGMRSVLAGLLRGDRIGHATDAFNMNWAAVGTVLTEALHARQHKPDEPVAALRRYWIQRDDARNFMVLGDPAVRLRPDRMAPLP
jgi:hypothetical protein